MNVTCVYVIHVFAYVCKESNTECMLMLCLSLSPDTWYFFLWEGKHDIWEFSGVPFMPVEWEQESLLFLQLLASFSGNGGFVSKKIQGGLGILSGNIEDFKNMSLLTIWQLLKPTLSPLLLPCSWRFSQVFSYHWWPLPHSLHTHKTFEWKWRHSQHSILWEE